MTWLAPRAAQRVTALGVMSNMFIDDREVCSKGWAAVCWLTSRCDRTPVVPVAGAKHVGAAHSWVAACWLGLQAGRHLPADTTYVGLWRASRVEITPLFRGCLITHPPRQTMTAHCINKLTVQTRKAVAHLASSSPAIGSGEMPAAWGWPLWPWHAGQHLPRGLLTPDVWRSSSAALQTQSAGGGRQSLQGFWQA